MATQGSEISSTSISNQSAPNKSASNKAEIQVVLHQTDRMIAEFSERRKELKSLLAQPPGPIPAKNPKIHIFPELYLTGYPLKDLCLHREFIEQYNQELQAIEKAFADAPKNGQVAYLFGGLHYLEIDGHHPRVQNVMFLGVPGGEKLEIVCVKERLPNYDIFDEKKYYTPGEGPYIKEWNGLKLGLLICEDLWAGKEIKNDPVAKLIDKDIDLLISINSSPFETSKISRRHERCRSIADALQAPMIYVNQVGGEDEIVFDGGSFIQYPSVGDDDKSQSGDLDKMEHFLSKSEEFTVKLTGKLTGKLAGQLNEGISAKAAPWPNEESKGAWDGLFNAKIDPEQKRLVPPTQAEFQEILGAITAGLAGYTRKNRIGRWILGLSGGIDSALVLYLAHRTKSLVPGLQILPYYLPGLHSSGLSTDISEDLCQKLKIPFKVFPIKFLHSTFAHSFKDQFKTPLEGLADENIQSRLRGMVLMAQANSLGGAVLNTSNKSEIAVGYSTLYGDGIGALSLIGDLYKSEIFPFCQFINEFEGQEIFTKTLLERPPTAELRENQQDSQSLPDYLVLDSLLEAYLSFQYTRKEIIELGFDEQTVDRVIGLFNRAEFKRHQFCPIIKLKPRSFGFGHRIPISKASF